MGYKLSKLGEDVLRDVVTFCERYVAEQGRAADRAGGFLSEKAHDGPLREMYERMADMGLPALFVPESAGGPALTYEDKAAILEEIGRADGGLGVSLMTTALTRYVLDRFGTQAQRDQCLEKLEAGYHGAFCLTEYQAGSDISCIRATARDTGDGKAKALSGTKAFVTNAGVAGYFIVFAKDAGVIKAYFVPGDASGITVGEEEEKLGVKNSSTCEVNFNNVPAEDIPGDDSCPGAPTSGRKIVLESLDYARIWCAVVATGIARAALDISIKYAKEREQFGKTIGENDVIRAKIADMYMKTAGARALCREAIRKLEEGEELTLAASTAKTTASDAAVYCALEAVQIMGGYGYCKEYPAEKLLRDAKAFQIFEGTGEIQRMIVGRELLK